MDKHDMVNAFQEKINELEEKFFDDYKGRMERLKNIYGDKYLYEKSVIGFPFRFDFYIKENKCNIKFNVEIRVIE